MPSQIGWSTEAYLLAQIKKLIAQMGAMSGGGGITSLNGLTDASQTFAVGTAGAGFSISSAGGVHTFNIPNASGSAKGLLTAVDWTTFNNKQNALTNPVTGTGTTNYISRFTATGTIGNSEIFQDGTNIGVGTTLVNAKFHVNIQSDSDNEIARFSRLNAAGTDQHLLAIFADPVNNFITYRSTGTNSGGHIWQTASTERMRLTAAGVLGVGTASPDAGTILHTARATSGTVATFGIQGLTINPRIRIDASEADNTVSFNTNYNGATSPAIRFLTQEAERMRLTAAGELLVGTTTDYGAYTLQNEGGFYAGAVGSPGLAIQVEDNGAIRNNADFYIDFGSGGTGDLRLRNGSSFLSAQTIKNNGRTIFNGSTDAGYQVDVQGTLRSTQGANFATSSGDVSIGNASTGNLFIGNTTAAISSTGSRYIYNEFGNGTGVGPEIILHNTVAQDGSEMALSFSGVRSGAGIAAQIKATRRGILSFLTQDLPSATPTLPTERMRITSAGNVLIGTTTDGGQRFQVNGSATFAANSGTIQIAAASPFYTGANISTGANNFGIGTTGATLLGFFTNNTERIRITSAGLVGIAAAPVAQLHVRRDGAGYTELLRLENRTSSEHYLTIEVSDDDNFVRYSSTGGNNGGHIWRSSSELMRLTLDGRLLLGTTTDLGQMLQVSGTTLLSNTVTFANSNTGGVSWGNPSINGGSQIFFRSLTTNWVGLVNSSSHGIFITNTNANVLIGNLYSDSVGGVRTIVHNNGTAPTGNVTDSYQLYSNDIVAGNAAPHFRTENGAVVKVYQETTGVAAATRVGGGGTTVTDTDTFDGYTIAQVVRALRNQGLLA